MGDWTPERDAALVERLAKLEDRLDPAYWQPEQHDLRDLRAALVEAREDAERYRSVVAEVAAKGRTSALETLMRERDAAVALLDHAVRPDIHAAVVARAERAEEAALVAQSDRVYAASIQRGDDEGELLAARQAVRQLALGHLSVPAAIERLNRMGLDALDRAEQAEADRDAHAAEARELRARVERLTQGATAHRERAERAEAERSALLTRAELAEADRDTEIARVERAEALLREALPFVDPTDHGAPGLLARIRAHLSARPPEPEAPGPLTVEMVMDLLVLADVPTDAATVGSWTAAQREEAAEWAGAVHVHASDNDDVEVPPVPAHVVAVLPAWWREAIEGRAARPPEPGEVEGG